MAKINEKRNHVHELKDSILLNYRFNITQIKVSTGFLEKIN